MSTNIKQSRTKFHSSELIASGVALLSQQIWCWGRDILREEGNWLIEQGFELIKAPVEQEDAKNIYSLYIAEGRRVMLRGFGVVYTDDRYGSIFVPRYELIPKYAPSSELKTLPWSADDLLEFSPPIGVEKQYCSAMLAELIDWIITFERDLLTNLGTEYRLTTLDSWDNGERRVFPAQNTISEWEKLRNDVEDLIQMQQF